MDGLTKSTNLSKGFIGLILLPNVGNAAGVSNIDRDRSPVI